MKTIKSLLLLIIGAVFFACFSANDSATTYTETVTKNWKRAVIGIQRDTSTKAITILINQKDLQYLTPDSINGNLYNSFGANNNWSKGKMEKDSALGKSMYDLMDSLFVHAGKYLKKQAK